MGGSGGASAPHAPAAGASVRELFTHGLLNTCEQSFLD
jgi:hypothetical protein